MNKDLAGRTGSFLVWVAAAIMTVLVVIHCYILERPVKSDEGGFLNPPLEYLHTGRVVYPAHGPDHAQSMIVHPPVHYALIGLVMKAGLNFYPATTTLALLAWLALVAAVLTAPWNNILKAGFLIAGYLPNFVLVDLDPSRPELQMALAWLAALILLESGRLLGWEKYRLAIGSFLLAYASGLHYFALPAAAACGFYVLWILFELGWRKGAVRAAYAVGGAALFLLPYCIWFLLPEFRAIYGLIASLDAASNPTQGFKGIVRAFQTHRVTYQLAYGYMFPAATEYKSVFLDLLKPLLVNGIPAVFFSTPVLLVWRQTRGLAIAALPFQLSILLFFNHKSLPYYRGELSLFYAALLVGVCWSLQWLATRIVRPAAPWVAPAAVAALSVLLVADTRAWTLREGAVFVDELALARAAGKQVLPPDAVVGGRAICLWYTSGARYYRNFVADLIYPPDVSKIDVTSYFGAFDSVAEEPTGSWLTYNSQKLGTASWYVNGVLQLQGFYAGRRIRGAQYGYYLAGVRKDKPLEAYFWRERKFYRFLEDPTGDSAVMSLMSPHGGAWTSLGDSGPYLLAVALPPGEQDYVTFHVVTRPVAEAFQQKHPADTTIREVVYGKVSPADPAQLAAKVDYHREMTQIYYTTPELLATQVTTSAPQAIPLDPMMLPGKEAPVGPAADRHARYRAEPVTSGAVVYSPIVTLQEAGPHVISFRLRIRSGRVVISVVRPSGNSVAAQLFKYHEQPILEESILISVDDSRKIQFMVWANNASPATTDFEIEGLQAAPARWKNPGRIPAGFK
jgi:hypothetical protein